MDTVDANTGNSRAVIFQNAGNDFVNGLRMATNLDFGMDYARNAAAYLENGNYVKAGIFEIEAALEVVLDLGVAYYGAGIFGGVVEGAKTALATGSLIQGFTQANQQISKFTEDVKTGVTNTWNTATAPAVNAWNASTSAVSDAFSKSSKEIAKTATPGFKDWLNKGNADNKVYFGIKDDIPQYTGITKQTINARLSQHNANDKDFQTLRVQFENLTRNQARAVEQFFIENGPNEMNEINSISPNNKYYQDAMNWVKGYLGEK